MPDTISSIPRIVVVNWGVPLALVFWYACRVRHPARTRFRAFLMALAVVAVVLPAALAGLYYYVVNNEGSPFLVVPAFLALPFVLRALIRGWLGSPPTVRRAPERSRHGTPSRPMPLSAVSPPGRRPAPAPNCPPCRRGPGVSPAGPVLE